MTTEQEFQAQVADMWADYRKDGDMVVDAPSSKVGMPYAAPFEGACFPVELDGRIFFVSIPAEQAERFAKELLEKAALSMAMERECHSEMVAHEAISKAKGE